MAQEFARKEWIGASKFDPRTEAEAIELAFERTAAHVARGERETIALLDLDSSLYDTTHRTRKIVSDWLASKPAISEPTMKKLAAAASAPATFSLLDLFEAIGLMPTSDPAAHDAFTALQEFWKDRFFTNEYLPTDVAFPGAAAFARSLHKLGASVIYLTGRDRPGMEMQTIANFARDGFPRPGTERCELWMKPQREGDDFAFKMSWIPILRSRGEVVVCVENEPRNYVGFLDAFPDAVHFFCETVQSPAVASPAKGGFRMRHYAHKDWKER